MEVLPLKLKDNKFLIIILILIAIFIFIFICFSYIISKEIIYSNIKIQGIDVGSLSKNQAKEKITLHFKDILNDKVLLLSCEEKIWEVPYNEFDANYNIDQSINEAYALGKEGNLFYKIRNYLILNNKGKDISLNIEVNSDKIKERIELLAEEVEEDATDAKIKYEDGEFIITSEKEGVSLQKMETEMLLIDGMKNLSEQVINLPIKHTNPKITATMLKNIKEKMASFTTRFNPDKEERTENLKIASNMINGKVLLPGEIFSAFETIGPITNTNGYKNAPVMINGKLEQDVGGGVCQVVTNVYNVAVRSNLEIIERRHHSFPVSYVTIGQDATIAGDWIDMKFKNTLNHPIYIQIYLSGDNLITNIYGDKEGNTQEIKLETEILEVIPPNITYKKDHTKYTDYFKIEKESKKGYKANVYKVIYHNKKIIKKELLHHDHYKPVHGIIVVGIKGTQ